jgi:hypothetical protein
LKAEPGLRSGLAFDNEFKDNKADRSPETDGSLNEISVNARDGLGGHMHFDYSLFQPRIACAVVGQH